jgi:hypothetical protein
VLILKLIVVPLALLLLGIAERVHGPRAAGWLAGFPVIAGPLLWFITIDQGKAFGTAAALAAFYGAVPWLVFCTVYAAAARRLAWGWCALCGFLAWGVAALLFVAIQAISPLLQAVPFAAAFGAMWFHARVKAPDEQHAHRWWRLAVRMLAGAIMTFAVAQLAGRIGSRWSGTLAVFPVIGSIVAISNHVEHGKRAVQEAVAGMMMGILSVEAFCFALFQTLGTNRIWVAFALSLLAALTAQGLTWSALRKIN